jgi:DNA-binding IclR family transcriptional regulator
MEAKALGARVLEKSIDLLYSFESHRPEQSLFQISRNLGFPPSTARRLLKAMMSRRLIQQDGVTKLYRLGPGLFYLAAVAREGLEIRKIAYPFMERLRDITGENAVLHELRDGKRVASRKSKARKCCETLCESAINFRPTRAQAARSCWRISRPMSSETTSNRATG